MNLYIEIKDGQPINHPAFEENLLQAFGSISSDWEPFVRIERPNLGVYQVMESEEPTYQKINDVWTDVWSFRDMTAEEKAAKQQEVKDSWATRDQASNWASWIFNEETCSYHPPIPRPTDRVVIWNGANNDWVDLPQKPNDGKTYKLDFYTSSWVEVTE